MITELRAIFADDSAGLDERMDKCLAVLRAASVNDRPVVRGYIDDHWPGWCTRLSTLSVQNPSPCRPRTHSGQTPYGWTASHSGKRWKICLIRTGESYENMSPAGWSKPASIHQVTVPLVEFNIVVQGHVPQFVARAYRSTLLGLDNAQGINAWRAGAWRKVHTFNLGSGLDFSRLPGGQAEWRLDEKPMTEIRQWLNQSLLLDPLLDLRSTHGSPHKEPRNGK